MYLVWYGYRLFIAHLNSKYWDHMKNIMSRVLSVLVLASWAGSVTAEPNTDTVTVDGIASVKADAAGEGAEYSTTNTNSGNTNTGQMAGRVFINPATGKLGGPPSGVQAPGLSIATQKKLSRSGNGLRTRQLPDGTVLVDLQGRFQNLSAVTLDKDGEAHLTCSHSADHIEKAMVQGAEPPIYHGDDKP